MSIKQPSNPPTATPSVRSLADSEKDLNDAQTRFYNVATDLILILTKAVEDELEKRFNPVKP